VSPHWEELRLPFAMRSVVQRKQVVTGDGDLDVRDRARVLADVGAPVHSFPRA